MVRDTSIDAYRNRDENLEQWIYETYLYLNSKGEIPTDREVALFLGVYPNVVRPKRNALVRKGRMKEAGKRVCKVSGKRVYTWIALPKKVLGGENKK
jgi:hypothetical protein